MGGGWEKTMVGQAGKGERKDAKGKGAWELYCSGNFFISRARKDPTLQKFSNTETCLATCGNIWLTFFATEPKRKKGCISTKMPETKRKELYKYIFFTFLVLMTS